MFTYCDYCGQRVGIFNLRKRRTEHKGQDLTFCSPQCRNCYMRDIDAKNVAFTIDQGRPFEESHISSELAVTCPNCGAHEFTVPNRLGSYKLKCPNTRYVAGIGKYVIISVKRNGKVEAR